MLRRMLLGLGMLVLSLAMGLSGCNCGKTPTGPLCYYDSDCPANLPTCVSGLCQAGGTPDGGNVDSGPQPDTPSGPCVSGQSRSCYTGPTGTANKGSCRAGTQLCIGGKWDTCEGQTVPAKEVCDGADNNCDGVVDEVCQSCTPGEKQPCYTGPAATSGKGICKAGERVCLGTKQWGDCQGQVLPSEEVCDSADNDCNGKVDDANCATCKDGETRSCYSGPAGTVGKGPCKAGRQTCKAGKWGACAGEVKPTSELCDKVDNDCDGNVDDSCLECRPGATRLCYPSGKAGCKLTNAGYSCVGTCKTGVETCAPNGKWGFCENAVVPRSEDCNGKDDDCDGTVDEDLSPPPCAIQKGACAGSVKYCDPVTGWVACNSNQYKRQNPKAQLGKETDCDGVDNNCDGQVDENCTAGCTNGEKRSCYSGPATTNGKGICKRGTQTCSGGKWGSCSGQVLPKTETCNGADDDCDGYIDESFPQQGKFCTTTRPGICAQGIYTCASGKLSCTSLVQPRTEICNGKDDDCNGKIDDGAQTVTYYRDADGDNYGDPNVTKKACVRPAGYVTNNQDCYDKNSNAFPGQPGFFIYDRGDGSFDYNCDGQETKRFTKKVKSCDCQSPVIDIGFLDPAGTACGVRGKWLDRCRFDVGKCLDITIDKYQECR